MENLEESPLKPPSGFPLPQDSPTKIAMEAAAYGATRKETPVQPPASTSQPTVAEKARPTAGKSLSAAAAAAAGSSSMGSSKVSTQLLLEISSKKRREESKQTSEDVTKNKQDKTETMAQPKKKKRAPTKKNKKATKTNTTANKKRDCSSTTSSKNKHATKRSNNETLEDPSPKKKTKTNKKELTPPKPKKQPTTTKCNHESVEGYKVMDQGSYFTANYLGKAENATAVRICANETCKKRRFGIDYKVGQRNPVHCCILANEPEHHCAHAYCKDCFAFQVIYMKHRNKKTPEKQIRRSRRGEA